MHFKDIIGLEIEKVFLRQIVENNHLPHALLFLGPKGCGKLPLAIAFAQYILCEQKQSNGACGNCDNCQKASRFIHPDIHFSYPIVGSKVNCDTFLSDWRSALTNSPYLGYNQWMQLIGAENKQGNINKEECVNIIKKLSLKTFEASHKILIMWLPEFLGKEGNRLLKLIEEPPEQTLFILVAEDSEKILNTILSRCQLLKFSPLSDEAIADEIIKKTNVGREKAISTAHLANGDFNEALRLIHQKEGDYSSMFLDWLRKCYKGHGPEMVQWVNQFADLGRENQKQLILYGLHFLREYTLLKVAGLEKLRLTEKELETARNLTNVIAFDQVETINNLLSDCHYYIERNANPKVLFLDASIQMNQILKRKRPEKRFSGIKY